MIWCFIGIPFSCGFCFYEGKGKPILGDTYFCRSIYHLVRFTTVKRAFVYIAL